eukprot:458488-Rhodomonas_salina.5
MMLTTMTSRGCAQGGATNSSAGNALHPRQPSNPTRRILNPKLLFAYTLATPSPYGLAQHQNSGPVRYAICLRACYAKSGTDTPYGATRATESVPEQASRKSRGKQHDWLRRPGKLLRRCYAMPGTDIAYQGSSIAGGPQTVSGS